MAESTIQQRTVTSPTVGPINITSCEFKAHSDEFYARLRQETPVFRTTLPDKQTVWLVTRYDDVAMVLKDDRFSKSFQVMFDANPNRKMLWIPKVFIALMHHMLDTDPPEHTRLRPSSSKRLSRRLSNACGRASRS